MRWLLMAALVVMAGCGTSPGPLQFPTTVAGADGGSTAAVQGDGLQYNGSIKFRRTP